MRIPFICDPTNPLLAPAFPWVGGKRKKEHKETDDNSLLIILATAITKLTPITPHPKQIHRIAGTVRQLLLANLR